jgi:hypothetical protein
MAVDAEVTRHHIREELALVADLAQTHQWAIAPDYERLTVTVRMQAHTGDLFIVEFQCDDYKEVPPFIEFVDPDTGVRGTKRAYPKTIDSFFHESGPCICAPFSRKAYKSVVDTGPHQDWQFGDWQTSTANNVRWSNASKLGDMIGMIHTRLSRSDLYQGRMQKDA